VVNVEKSGEPVGYEASIWHEIQESVNEWESESAKFTIEIHKEWFEALESLTEWMLNGSKTSPEEALEIAIFSQIKEQL